MQHLNRWRTVTATATTAALAAGAFGIATVVSGAPAQPEAIQIAASGPAEEVEVLPVVVDVTSAGQRFDDDPSTLAPAPRSQPSPRSVDSISPRSIDSPSEAARSAGVRSTTPAPRVASFDSPSSPSSPPSPPSPPSMDSPSSPTSPSSPPSPDSPSSVDSVSSVSS